MLSLMLNEHKGVNGIYNLGTGNARSFDDLVKATFNSMDKKVNIEYIEMPEHLKDQYQYYTQAETKKVNIALPDFKFHTLEEGVDDYVKNYLATDNPFESSRK
jgi:ADP-L-glycero-D-manno-heptose 6-epimerase